jgi:hypothetical protein
LSFVHFDSLRWVCFATSTSDVLPRGKEKRMMVDPARDGLAGRASLVGGLGDGPAADEGLLRQQSSGRNRVEIVTLCDIVQPFFYPG